MTVIIWSFISTAEGWSFIDGSTGGATSSMAYNLGAQSLRCTLPDNSGVGHSIANPQAPIADIPIVPGDKIEFDYSAVTPVGQSLGNQIFVTLDTVTSLLATSGDSGAATLVGTFSTSQTLNSFFLQFEQVSPTITKIRDVLEVRLTVAAVPTTDIRPLEMDVDVDSGSHIWITYLDLTSLELKLRVYESDLSAGGTFDFGAATEAQVDARTFYLSSYAPGFFGTADLDDIIYVYGRWNDGAVTHIEKSTDGGASFTDIGDSATWGVDWVGGFFADDANILYAFVNGGSPALYRSINAGTTWTNLSTLPFDVDPGGVSKHPDGRILISNRAAGAQTAAYAVSPDYSSWIDATGSPSFPTTTPGAGSNAIIWVT